MVLPGKRGEPGRSFCPQLAPLLPRRTQLMSLSCLPGILANKLQPLESLLSRQQCWNLHHLDSGDLLRAPTCGRQGSRSLCQRASHVDPPACRLCRTQTVLRPQAARSRARPGGHRRQRCAHAQPEPGRSRARSHLAPFLESSRSGRDGRGTGACPCGRQRQQCAHARPEPGSFCARSRLAPFLESSSSG